ncbi:MAG: ABC transporter ATP-binding protein [Gammaproteobacteria bacterium]|nr:ABC transporter ATP-binding protein [Gammaproteobacteria bacterium]NIR85280.1 ABC transporter ATP-binding protein [Gammaproteobacteria bacterium]NIR88396.1 ABC transporter ATP-binding protein [Gammaproteobacteria bacterium]NIU06346.1 ABC transporter ATP-binding protein [Gammaproteobacteria bacterium]NIV53245.1 ATP-binding cassette domain-containing protein [Gammaproteobacteria bacterium]
MNAEVLLSVDDVHVSFGGLKALDGVSLEVTAGHVYGLIGPNGSGKTTLFNVITGFISPDRGRIVFEDRPIGGLSPDAIARRGLCRTFQANINPHRMTVMENMLLAPQGQVGERVLQALLHPLEVRRQERENLGRAWHLLALVKLSDKANAYVGNLSGGQKKLLALAQALMVKPRLILLDEPVAGVNPRLIEDILEVIRRLRGEGQNFLIVEHNMRVIRQVCDGVSVLDAGRVIAQGPAEETLRRDDVLQAYLARRPVVDEERDAAP